MDRGVLEKPFDPSLIKQRKGPFGGQLSYVEGAEYIRRLNDGLDARWSFEVLEHHVLEDEVFVLGKLTAGEIVKIAFGGSAITKNRDGKVVALADDLKGAATDALKKAASMLGVGLELYSKDGQSEARGARKSRSNGSSRPANNGQDRRRGSNGPSLSERQFNAIVAIAKALGWTSQKLSSESVARYGVDYRELRKADASALIDELQRESKRPS